MTTHFLYLFDPLCGWCYGASAGIATLAAKPGVIVEPVPSGLFAGDGARQLGSDMVAHIKANDRQIAVRTGAVFGDAYQDHVVGSDGVRLDSGLATLALSAVAATAPAGELAALAAIQRARYVDGRAITDIAVLREVLTEAGFAAAADLLVESAPALHEANRQRLSRARALMQRFAISGVPALLRDDGKGPVPVDAAPLYADPRALLAVPGVA